MKMESRHYIVSGRVQGVGFRWFVQRQAQKLGIKGWVRNRRDSTVEIRAEGAAHILDELETLLKTGPPGAYIKELRSESLQPISHYRGFDITY